MKFTRSIILIASLAALAGCTSEEELRGAAEKSVKETLNEVGTDFAYKSVTGDGSESLIFNDVTLKASDGAQLEIDILTFNNPDLSPMVAKWYSSSDLATGFKAESVTAENVTLSMNDMPLGAVADTMTLSDYDSTRKGAFRYSSYGLKDLVFSQAGMEVGRINEGNITVSNWVDGLLSPLKSTIDIKGTASLASTGLQLFIPGIPASLDWGFKGDADINLDDKTADIGAELTTNSFGNLSMKVSAEGVERDLVEHLQASLKDQTIFQRTFTNSNVPTPEAQKIIDASAKVALVDAEVKGSGLEWVGPIMKMFAPNHEQKVVEQVRSFETGFGEQAGEADAQESVKALYAFLMNPGAFVLSVNPEIPFVVKEAEETFKRSGAPFKVLGVKFQNGN